MLMLGEFSLFISLTLQCPLCFLCDACRSTVKFKSDSQVGLSCLPTLHVVKEKPSWQFSLFATQHPFCGSCSISCPVNWSAPWDRPHLHSADKVNALCDRTIFFYSTYAFCAHSYTHTQIRSCHLVSNRPDFGFCCYWSTSDVFVGGVLWEITLSYLSYIHWSLHAYTLHSLNFQGLIYCSSDISSHKHRSSSLIPPVT